MMGLSGKSPWISGSTLSGFVTLVWTLKERFSLADRCQPISPSTLLCYTPKRGWDVPAQALKKLSSTWRPILGAVLSPPQ